MTASSAEPPKRDSDPLPGLAASVIWPLVAALVIGAVALILYARNFPGPLTQTQDTWGQFGDFLGGVLNPVLQAGALWGVIVSLAQAQRQLRTARDQHHEELATQDSEFFLNEARRGVESAFALLADHNNQRTQWILAARTLERALAIASEISRPAHIKVWELALEAYRIRAAELLGLNDPVRTAPFFYGSPVLPDGTTVHGGIDEAARFSSQDRTIRYLDENSLSSFWRLSEYPNRYGDPLPDKPFTDAELNSVHMHAFSGLQAFLRHRRDFGTHAGQLIPNRRNA